MDQAAAPEGATVEARAEPDHVLQSGQLLLPHQAAT